MKKMTALFMSALLSIVPINAADVMQQEGIPIPLAAQRFVNAVLIYGPNLLEMNDLSDNGIIRLPFAALANSLEGTFDLSQCGDTGKYLSISTGYRKEVKPENARKMEIWITPRFLMEKNHATAGYFKYIEDKWPINNDLGIFWNWGKNNLFRYDYFTSQNMASQNMATNLSDNNLGWTWLNRCRRPGDDFGWDEEWISALACFAILFEQPGSIVDPAKELTTGQGTLIKAVKGGNLLTVEAKREEKEAPAAQQVGSAVTPVMQQEGIPIPRVAQGYEGIYEKFFKGALICRPDLISDYGRIDLPIAALANPLGGAFDLSPCDDTSKYFIISTGYRKRVNPVNANKIEIWLAPKFLIEKELATTAGHLKDIVENEGFSDAEVGIFWNRGEESLSHYDYLVLPNMATISENNLYEHWWSKHTRSSYDLIKHTRSSYGRMLNRASSAPPLLKHFTFFW